MPQQRATRSGHRRRHQRPHEAWLEQARAAYAEMAGLAESFRERLAGLFGTSLARGELIEIAEIVLHRPVDHFDVVFAQPVAQEFIAVYVFGQIALGKLFCPGERQRTDQFVVHVPVTIREFQQMRRGLIGATWLPRAMVPN